MSVKNESDVLIGGKVYKLSGFESEEYLQKVAGYINNKISEIEGSEGARNMTMDMKAIMIELNIADDYFKAKETAEKLEEDIEAKEKEIYDLRHENVSAQIRFENLEKTIAELQNENKELLIKNAKLEG
ncbi:MAG: cell division protein ZapA [Eubacterium sp.]|nr:cell division protein ZapA [Eubacterium sp.]